MPKDRYSLGGLAIVCLFFIVSSILVISTSVLPSLSVVAVWFFPSAGSPTQAELVSYEAAQGFSNFQGQSWLPPLTPWTWHAWADRKSCGGISSLCLSSD
jgi:hypothetical protein